MSEINDAALIAALRRHMTVAAAKQVVAAGNLANVSTPGYKARELDFSATLDQKVQGGALKVTHAAHQQPPGASTGVATTEARGLDARRDGNTVHIDRELLGMTRAAGEFARAQTALAAKFRLVRYAISEGR